jgi:hypothetical protein
LISSVAWVRALLVSGLGRLHGVEPAEVIDALYSPRQYDNESGDLLFVCGQADSGRLLTIRCQRVAPEVLVYGIVAVRLANEVETAQWRRRFA